MNAAAAANTGWQRAASHSNRGNNRAIGTTLANDPRGRKITSALVTVIASKCQGTFEGLVRRRRVAYGRGNSDQQRRNRHNAECVGCEPVLPDGQARHSREVKQLEPQSSTDPRDGTREDRSRQQSQDLAQPVEGETRTKQALDNRPAASNASPALHKAKVAAPAKVLSPNRLAAIVAAAAPIATGHLARGPSAIRTPAATPEAGQNTATPSGFVSSERLSRAARK